MWIRKTQQEMMNERRVRLLGTGLCVAVVASLLILFGLPHAGFHISIGFRIVALLAAGIMLLAWYRRAHWRRVQSSVCVCEECGVVNANKQQATCACGGTLRSLNEMNWLEMPPSEEFPCPPLNGQHALRAAEAI